MSFPKFRLAPLFLLLLATCTDSPTAPSPQPLTVSRNLVAGDEIKPRFLFLPPLGPEVRRIDGSFDGSLQPVVEVCEWNAGTCVGAVVARFTTAAGHDQIRVFGNHHGDDGRGNSNEDSNRKGTNNESRGNGGHGGSGHDAGNDRDTNDEYYGVDWNTSRSPIVGGKIYRLRALLGGTELGHVDVRFSTNGNGGDDDRGSGHGASVSFPDVITARKDRTLPIQFWIEKPLQRITVVLDRGVAGSPTAVDSMFRFGSVIRYSFQPMEGFENVLVSLDGRLVPRSGVVVADTTHELYATADRIVTLTPELMPLYQSARGILSAADPIAATQAYLNQATEYVSTHDAAAAMLQLRDVHYLAFDQLRDTAALRRLDAALANHVFQIGGGSAVPNANIAVAMGSTSLATSSARFMLSAAARDPSILEKTRFMYINGVLTTEDAAFSTAILMGIAKDEIGRFRGNSDVAMNFFYNRTHSVLPTKLDAQLHCIAGFLSLVDSEIKGRLSSAAYMAECMADADYQRLSNVDFIESARQAFNIAMRTDAAEPDAIALANKIQGMRDNGTHVILIPHSQGNLMAIQAIHRLRSVTQQYVPTRDSTCIGTVSLASPLSVGWELLEHNLAHVVVRGDLIPDLIGGGNTWPRIDTDSSSATFLERLGIFTLSQSLHLHSVESSYLTGQARDSVKAGMNEVYDACTIDHMDVAPLSVVLSRGATKQLEAFPVNTYGDTLAGRHIDWTSSQSSIASVSETGRVAGDAPGSALVTATNHGVSADIAVTVLQPVLPIFPSSYTASVPPGFEGEHYDAAARCEQSAPYTLTIRFLVGGQVFVALDNHQDFPSIIAQIYSELFFPSGVSIRGGPIFMLYWNADRSQLTGTMFHSMFVCGVGFFEQTDAITFNRL